MKFLARRSAGFAVSALASGFVGSGAAAQGLEIDTAAVDAIFAEYDRDDGPGCVLGIVHDGELVFARGYGMANLEHDVPLAPDSVLRIGSTSKQFTAACAVLAEQEGLLSLDDDVRAHVPELPDLAADGEPITVRQLLHHTSGIRDYLELMTLAGYGEDDHYTDEDVVAMLARQRGLNFEPGTRHLYSNSGYFLISVVLERASGQTLAGFAEQRLFGPLGMEDTHFHDDHTRVVKRRADGYAPGAGGAWHVANTTLEMCGDGGVFTTVRDMRLWEANFQDPKVGGQALLDALLTPGVLDDGTVLDYALGLVLDRYRGLRQISHGGAFVGFRAQAIRFPDERVSIVCFANLSLANPTVLARRVADVVLVDRFPAAAGVVSASTQAAMRAAPTFVELPADALARYAGEYVDLVNADVYEVAPEHGGLHFRSNARSFLLQPTSVTAFRAADGPATASFEPASAEEPGGPWRGLLALEGQSLPFVPHVPWDPESMSTTEYAGDYYSPELDAWWRIEASDRWLHVAIGGASGPSTRSQARALDVFRVPLGVIAFERDAFQAVAGFDLNGGRVRGLRFDRRSR